MAALRASTLVCSVMSEISSTISPISWDDSPRRLMRLAVSWICSRISFMPRIESCTAWVPFSAADRDCWATSAERLALPDTWFIERAMSSTERPAAWISSACFSAAASSSEEFCLAISVAAVTRLAASLMRPTSTRSSSMV